MHRSKVQSPRVGRTKEQWSLQFLSLFLASREEARRAAGPNRAEKPLPAADPSLDRLIAKSVIMASMFAVDVAAVSVLGTDSVLCCLANKAGASSRAVTSHSVWCAVYSVKYKVCSI